MPQKNREEHLNELRDMKVQKWREVRYNGFTGTLSSGPRGSSGKVYVSSVDKNVSLDTYNFNLHALSA